MALTVAQVSTFEQINAFHQAWMDANDETSWLIVTILAEETGCNPYKLVNALTNLLALVPQVP